MPLMSRLTCCNIGQSKTVCLLWAYCETLKLIETLLPMNGLSYLDHPELNLIKLVKNGAQISPKARGPRIWGLGTQFLVDSNYPSSQLHFCKINVQITMVACPRNQIL